jgi:uncharacterized low-complexity protein
LQTKYFFYICAHLIYLLIKKFKEMKKLLTLLMVAGMFSLVACGPSEEEKANAEAEASAQAEQVMNEAVEEATQEVAEEVADSTAEGEMKCEEGKCEEGKCGDEKAEEAHAE